VASYRKGMTVGSSKNLETLCPSTIAKQNKRWKENKRILWWISVHYSGKWYCNFEPLSKPNIFKIQLCVVTHNSSNEQNCALAGLPSTNRCLESGPVSTRLTMP